VSVEPFDLRLPAGTNAQCPVASDHTPWPTALLSTRARGDANNVGDANSIAPREIHYLMAISSLRGLGPDHVPTRVVDRDASTIGHTGDVDERSSGGINIPRRTPRTVVNDDNIV
jgi:hypothetical protein